MIHPHTNSHFLSLAMTFFSISLSLVAQLFHIHSTLHLSPSISAHTPSAHTSSTSVISSSLPTQKSCFATTRSQQQKAQTCPSRQTYSPSLFHTVFPSPWLIHTPHNKLSIPGYHRGIEPLLFLPHTLSFPAAPPSTHLAPST